MEKGSQVPSILINLNWYYAIQPYVKDKAHGGPFDTPFVNPTKPRPRFSLALFPEMIHMEDAEDFEFHGFLAPGHVDTASNAYQRAIPWYAHMGLGTIEIAGNPEDVVGKAKLADAEKAREGVEALLDYRTSCTMTSWSVSRLVCCLRPRWLSSALPKKKWTNCSRGHWMAESISTQSPGLQNGLGVFTVEAQYAPPLASPGCRCQYSA
jgi:hypothetical protein